MHFRSFSGHFRDQYRLVRRDIAREYRLVTVESKKKGRKSLRLLSAESWGGLSRSSAIVLRIQPPGSSDGPVLVNLADDPLERKNQSDKHQQKVRSMKELALEQLADIAANSLTLGGPASDRKPEEKRGLWLK